MFFWKGKWKDLVRNGVWSFKITPCFHGFWSRKCRGGLEIKGLGSMKAEAEAMEWLEIVGLAKFADAYGQL